MRPRTQWLSRRPNSRCALLAALLSASLLPTLRADYAAEVMSENPIVYYRFNDSVATDDLPSPAVNLGSAGAAANGGYTGGFVRGVPGALPGSANTAVQGAGNLVEIPNTAAINNAGSFSAEVWLKPTSIPATGALISPIASFRENDNVYGRAGWLIYQGDAATGFNFRAYNRNGSTFTFSITSGAGTVTAGAWHHVVATWDSTTNQGKLYVNGVLCSTSAVVTPSGPNNSTYEPNNTRPLTLGSRDGAFGWSGDLDEPAYYTSVLSGAQVLAHYNNGISPSPSQTYDSLVLAAAPAGYWRVGEAAFVPRTPPVATNAGNLGASANGAYYAGSKNTATGPAPSSGFQGFGANNSCLSLATANGYVGTALSLLNNRSAFTVMGWVKRGAVHSVRGGYFGQNDLLEFGDATNGADIESWISARGGNMITPYSFADDQWGFIVLTGDTTKATLYLNGVQVGQLSGTIANYGTSAFNFNIGGGGVFAATGDFFRGEIDEVAVFDKAVTPGRVKQLYDAALGGSGVDLVNYLPDVSPAGDIPEGQSYTLSVDATGTPPFTYQWKKDGVNVPNSNSRTLTVTAAANTPVTNPYEYTVVVTNLGGGASVTSDVAAVYVTPALKWTGTDGVNPGKWTIGGPVNWKTYTAGTGVPYSEDFGVVFDDSGTALTATLTENVQPMNLTVDSNTKNYTITGPFSLSTGSGGIVKNGTSTLQMNVNDLFVNTMTINGGTLKLGTGMVTGLYANAVVAVNAGTLDIGLPTGTPYSSATTVATGASLTVTGSGNLELTSGSAAISGAGNEVFNRNGTVLVNMANTIGGSVSIQTGTVAFDGSQNTNRLAANQSVTVSPGATMEIRGVNAFPTAANSISVVLNQATLNVISGGSTAIGATGTSHAHLKNLALNASTVMLGYSGGGGAYNGESFQLNGGITVTGSGASMISLGSGTNAGNSGVAISGAATHTISVANTAVGADLIIAAELENTDASAADSAASIVAKTGPGTLKLADGTAHSFSGTVQVNEGSLEATGSLAGPLTVASGASIVPGNAAIGTLATGTATLSGTYRCDIDAVVSDRITVNGNLTFGAGASIALNVGPGGVTAPSYELANCTGTMSGPLPTLSGTIPPGYTLQVVSSSSLVLAQGAINTQPKISIVPPSGNEDFSTSAGGFTVSAPVSPETDWAYSNGSWFSFGTDAATGVGTNTTYLMTPIYTVNAGGAVAISFSHSYNFEEDYDAGALEISVNGGAFTRVPGSAFTLNGYDGTLAAGTNSALAGQEGFLRASAGYPAFHTTTATLLASATAGTTVQVRFMGAYDDAYSAGGWKIDSFSITGALPSLLKLEWPLGTMQYSDNLQPPWTDLSADSPLLIDTKAAPRRFFQLKP
ncbi:LamG-like jellyroll fold domain-containing protein [Luteolibacter soli]|uniref:LamG-like jellyroll fold domain-containing protein n=1 Tax=Luteolibacter soli TaxID=3135280 RepID=A0ABU9AS36_9BACT